MYVCGFEVDILVCAVAFRGIELAKDVQLVKGREGHEDEVPNEKDDAQLLVKLPAVHVAHDDQEDDGWKQAERGVEQACEVWTILNKL